MDVSCHYFSQVCEKVSAIAAPLHPLQINFFAYLKTLPNQQHIWLCSHRAFTEYLFQENYSAKLIQQVPPFKGSILWSALEQEPIFSSAHSEFGIQSGMVVVEPNQNDIERYFFASMVKNSEVEAMYGFNRDVFQRFIHYFKDCAVDILSVAEEQALPIYHEEQDVSINKKHEKPQNVIQFFNQTPVKRFNINLNGKNIFIPKREAQVMAYMRKGLTAKEMARKMDISHRTIEFYRTNLKKRLAVLEPYNPFKVIYQCDNINTQIVGDEP